MTFEDLFLTIKEYLYKLDVSKVTSKFAVECHVTGTAAGIFYIEIQNGDMKVEPYNYYDRDGLICAQDESYLEICQGFLNPRMALATGRLHIDEKLQKSILKYFEKKC